MSKEFFFKVEGAWTPVMTDAIIAGLKAVAGSDPEGTFEAKVRGGADPVLSASYADGYGSVKLWLSYGAPYENSYEGDEGCYLNASAIGYSREFVSRTLQEHAPFLVEA